MKDERVFQNKDNNQDNGQDNPRPTKSVPSSSDRRGFLKTAGLSATVLAASSVVPSALVPDAEAAETGPPRRRPGRRAAESDEVRKTTSRIESEIIENTFPHHTNGDEERYRNQGYAGNFSKTLPHDPRTGLVLPGAYRALLEAFEQGTQSAFDAVPAGGPGKLAGPLSPLAFQLQGVDTTAGKQVIVPPSVASAAGAAELVELYWESVVRDVPFIEYGSNPLIAQAVADMNRLSAYGGPSPVTPQNIFRYGSSSLFPNQNAFFGATEGPYISQLLYQTHQLDGVTYVPQIRTNLPVADPNTGEILTGPGTGVDFVTNFPEYLFVENGNGAIQPSPNVTDPRRRFLRSGRDLGLLANQDSIYSIYFRAAIILANLGVPLQASTPYVNDSRIGGFNTFSTAWLFSLIGSAHQTEGPAFYQKWFVHRKLRPEGFGNLVDGILTHRFSLNPSIHSDLANSSVLPMVFECNRQLNVKRGLGTAGSYLLAQIPAGGSPSHPDPPAGHAFTAGCCVTLLKAVFNVGTPDNPTAWPATAVEAAPDGLSLVPVSENLTILGELNKLAFNVSEGRDWLGIHSRVGGNSLGMTLGEDVAIRLLEDLGYTYPEKFSGFTLTKFDGTVVTIGRTRRA